VPFRIALITVPKTNTNREQKAGEVTTIHWSENNHSCALASRRSALRGANFFISHGSLSGSEQISPVGRRAKVGASC
jgi:hypothetical protein